MSRSDLEFEELYLAHASRLLKVAHSIVRDRSAAEDVVQTAFAKAFAAWWRVGRADDPAAYVRRIVVNAALEHLRRPAHRHERPLADLPEHSVELGSPADSRSSEMWEVLGQLPPRRRAIVVLRYYEDLTEREIADVLRCRPGTVKSQASAALRTLRTHLGQAPGDSDALAPGPARGGRR